MVNFSFILFLNGLFNFLEIQILLIYPLSPMVMGSLWDVTDRDVDLLTERMLKFILNKEKPVQMPEALMVSRK